MSHTDKVTESSDTTAPKFEIDVDATDRTSKQAFRLHFDPTFFVAEAMNGESRYSYYYADVLKFDSVAGSAEGAPSWTLEVKLPRSALGKTGNSTFAFTCKTSDESLLRRWIEDAATNQRKRRREEEEEEQQEEGGPDDVNDPAKPNTRKPRCPPVATASGEATVSACTFQPAALRDRLKWQLWSIVDDIGWGTENQKEYIVVVVGAACRLQPTVDQAAWSNIMQDDLSAFIKRTGFDPTHLKSAAVFERLCKSLSRS